jgi:hypothetical protein
MSYSCLIKAQTNSLSNVRTKWIYSKVDTVLIDTLSIIPGSTFLNSIDSNDYQITNTSSIFKWIKKPNVDSVQLTYRVFPFNFSKFYFHKNPALIEKNFLISPYEYNENQANQSQPFIDFGKVDYGGSFARNLSFGNNQDVVLNSQFNMQLEGNLGDSIQLIGAITDNNIPFQPEGNTQQIQEFDRVFIQFKRKSTSFIIGDHDIKRPQSYLLIVLPVLKQVGMVKIKWVVAHH